MRRRVALLVGTKAGAGRALRTAPAVGAMLQARDFHVMTVTAAGAAEAAVMCDRLVRDGVDALIALGGDGTTSIALQAVAGTATALGIVPLGTGNDNAASAGLPAKDWRRAVHVIAEWQLRPVDAGAATTAGGRRRLFLGVMSSGFDAMVNERSEHLQFDLDIDGTRVSGPAMFTAIGNGSRYGGGMRVCEGALMDDGLLTMTWIHPLAKRRFVEAFPRVYRGTHLGLPQVEQRQGRRYVVQAPGQVAYADGERIGPLPVEVEVLPGAVTMLLPKR